MTKQAEENVRNGNGVEPAAVAKVIANAIEARKPRTRYLVGRDAKFLARVHGLLSDRNLDRLIARNLGLREPNPTGPCTQEAQRGGRPRGALVKPGRRFRGPCAR